MAVAPLNTPMSERAKASLYGRVHTSDPVCVIVRDLSESATSGRSVRALRAFDSQPILPIAHGAGVILTPARLAQTISVQSLTQRQSHRFRPRSGTAYGAIALAVGFAAPDSSLERRMYVVRGCGNRSPNSEVRNLFAHRRAQLKRSIEHDLGLIIDPTPIRKPHF